MGRRKMNSALITILHNSLNDIVLSERKAAIKIAMAITVILKYRITGKTR
jgi:hypothetical protein